MAYQRQMKKVMDTTTNSREYKLARRARIPGFCTMCKPHRGCNSRVYIRKNWKHYRKTQYKVIMYEVCGE